MAIVDISPLESRILNLPTVNDLPVILVIAVTLIVGYLLTIKEREPDVSHIPILGAELGFKGRKDMFAKSAKSFLERGYKEVNEAFQVQTTEGPRIILNVKQMEEVAAKPDNVVDNMRPNGRALMDQYTGYLDGDEVIFRIIKSQLSTRLGELGGILADQTDKCLAAEFPACKDWTPVNVYNSITRVVATVSTRIFAGKELTTNEEWLQTAIQYTGHLVACANALKQIPPWLRPFLYRFTPEYKRLRATNEAAVRLVKLLIQARREAMDRPDFNGGNDMLQWMLTERVNKSVHDRDYRCLAQFQLQLAFAAIHTTSMAVTNMLYDVVAHPELLEIIGEEVREELKNNNGSWEGQFLKKLQKTDSIMKESQRHNPVGFTGMDREIREPMSLSDGTYLPKGVTVSANSWQITHDPEVLQSASDPRTFDGLRYYNMRNQLVKTGLDEKEVAGKHQFVSISNGSLMFGYGKHACPGRFFAGNEIKLILAKLLTTFDIKIDPIETDRYANSSWEMSNYVDTTKTILMKRIT